MFRDSYGLIVTKSGDGGDTARREWGFWLGNHLRKTMSLTEESSAVTPSEVIDLLEPYQISQPGMIIRHPDPLQWWSDPKNTSRDQTLGAFVHGQIYDKSFLNRLIKAHRARWWMCSNGTDTLLLSSVVPRACGGLFNILLYITDWFFLFDFFVAIGWIPTYNDGKKKWTWYDPDDTGKAWNLCLAMCQPGHETPIRILMRWIFGNFMRESNGTKMSKPNVNSSSCIIMHEPHPIQAMLKWEARNDTPDLAEMWWPVIYKMFPRWRKK